jgi:3-oxoacyl-[acyl-carrier protein] reductase
MPGSPRSALVTGSTSGIGLAIALRLARSGYKVTLNYAADDQQAAIALDQCREADPDTLLVKADISTSAGAAALARQAIDAFGRLDVLVNNAARVIDKAALDMTEDDWDRVVDVNLKGAFLCSQHAARQMLTQDDGGVILNIGASTGIRGRRNGVNTCASKAGLMVMTQCLALELAPKIRVNTIIPGLVVTEETRQRFDLDDPATRRAREQAIPLQRLGRPGDVADSVMLMLAEESRFITGQKLVVDGGQNMWLLPPWSVSNCLSPFARRLLWRVRGLNRRLWRDGSCPYGKFSQVPSSWRPGGDSSHRG